MRLTEHNQIQVPFTFAVFMLSAFFPCSKIKERIYNEIYYTYAVTRENFILFNAKHGV
jgi:hypothetical protein